MTRGPDLLLWRRLRSTGVREFRREGARYRYSTLDKQTSAAARRLVLIIRRARPAKSPIDNVDLTSPLALSSFSGVMRRERW